MPSPFQPKPHTGPLRTERELEGTLERVVFASEDGAFSVARLRVAGEEALISISGTLAGAQPGEALRLQGEWKLHRKHGPTFEVAGYVPVLPTTTEAMKSYLGSGLVKGLGPVNAARIVDHFGEATLQVLDEAPERLAEVPRLSRKLGESLSGAWKDHRATHEIMLFLRRFDISPAMATRLVKHYGAEAASILRTNPHRVGMEVRGIGFLSADRIAQHLGIAKDSPQRIRAGMVHVLSEAQDDGHTYLPREALLAKAAELLEVDMAPLDEAFEAFAAENREIRLVVLPDGTPAVFTSALYKSETGVARHLRRLLASARPLMKDGLDARLDDFERTFRFELAPRQRDAIRSAAAGGVCVITGGPGTGKTTIIRALLHMLGGIELKIELCSPTGRAAQRLSETTNRGASTIHRLLKFNAEKMQFTMGPERPVEADLLVVDESSMLDIPLAFHLLQAIQDGTTVVFVGDIDQLPSVGPGNFLHDVIDSGRARTTRLDVIFRQAERSLIVKNAHRINHGEAPYLPAGMEGNPPPDFFFVERAEPEGVREAILALVRDRIPSRFGLDPADAIQVLTPMRRGPIGANEMNETLQEALNPRARSTPIAGTRFRVGDKVIQNSNNYELEVFNGDIGRVVSMDPETQTFRVVFGRRPVEYTLADADQLALAYAITIHKSQGSEYPAVVVPIHTTHYIMLRRNLLYTAVTRGKKLVVLVGTKRALFTAINHADVGRRFSALGAWLLRPEEGGGGLAG